MANFIKYFDNLPKIDKRTIAIAAIERLIEIGEVKFCVYDVIPFDEPMKEKLYWDSTGEDLRCPF